MTTPPGVISGDTALRRVAVTGASGLIGRALANRLRARGVVVHPMVRGKPSGPDEIRWDPRGGSIDAAALEGIDAMVHLAGEPVGVRWTADTRRRILESRVSGTELVARTIAGLARKPRVLVSASAVGYYGGAHGDEWLDESSPAGTDFLAQVCVQWEAAATRAAEAGIRVAHPRTGIVLDAGGGALARLLPLFRLGLGGRLGGGHQWMSWISLEDEVRAIEALLDDAQLAGPINLVAPEPVTNAEFTRALGRALHRPAAFTVPSFAMRLALGEMAEVALLGGQRAAPRALLTSGFAFRHPTLDVALGSLLADHRPLSA